MARRRFFHPVFMPFGVILIIRNNLSFGLRQSPGGNDRKWVNIVLILTHLRSSNPGSFGSAPTPLCLRKVSYKWYDPEVCCFFVGIFHFLLSSLPVNVYILIVIYILFDRAVYGKHTGFIRFCYLGGAGVIG